MGYYGVSDAIADILDEMVYVKEGFKGDLINYSALARMIKPLVDKKVNADISLDAVVVGIRRYAERFSSEQPSKQLYLCVSESKVSLQSDMACVHFKRSKDLFKKIVEIEFTLDYSMGERMYVIQRTDEITVICTSLYLPELLCLVKDDPSLLLEKQENLALATITLPHAGVYIPGVIHYFAYQFNKLGINLNGYFSSFTKISFLFDEKEASLMFDALTKSINEAESIASVL